MTRLALPEHGPIAVLTVGVASSILGVAAPAHADTELQAAASAGMAWTGSLPALKSAPTLTAARQLGETKVPTGGSLTSVGAGVDLGITVDDRLFIPAVGIAGYGAVGSYDAIVTSADGSIARVRPWSTYRLDVLLPGIGYRMKQRRWMFVTSLRTGVSGMYMGGSIAGGDGESLASLSGYSLVLQAELEACRRLDPVTRVCVQLAPRIYDFGFMNGATLGMRVEWGR